MWELKDIGKLLYKGREEKRIVRSEKLDKLREKAEKLGVRGRRGPVEAVRRG